MQNVQPDSSTSCGPYHRHSVQKLTRKSNIPEFGPDNHDTIGVIAIDKQGKIAAGTSTNGAINKIPGRIGDSPIAGAGAYADQEVGAAAGTGQGDVMMRFLPSYVSFQYPNIKDKNMKIEDEPLLPDSWQLKKCDEEPAQLKLQRRL